MGPAPFAIGAVDVCSDLAAVAASAVIEGCVGETLAAVQAAEQLAAATDPAVRSALEEIVRDETRHAELAWRFVAWAVEAGGEPVRRSVAAAFVKANDERPRPSPGPRAPELVRQLAAHGRIGEASLSAALDATFEETILPNAAQLARRGEERRQRSDSWWGHQSDQAAL